MKQYYTGIIFFSDDKKVSPRKYRNITNIGRFKLFTANCGGSYFNLYDKATKKFIARYYV
jgi:hypothetical protein